MINKEIIISSIFALTLFFMGLFLINNNSEYWEKQINVLSKKILHTQALILEKAVNRSTASAMILASHIYTTKGDMSDFNEYSKMMYRSFGGVSNLQLAPLGIIAKIYPLKGNEKAIGHDIFKSDNRKKEAFLAKKTKELTLAGPFPLIQGGIGIVARYPVYLYTNNTSKSPSFWGFTSALILLDELIKNTDLNSLKEKNYEFRLWRFHPDTKKIDVFFGKKILKGKHILSKAVKVPNGTWYLDIVYTGSSISNRLLLFTYFLNVLISFLLAYSLYLLLKQPQKLRLLVAKKTKELNIKNKQLEKEHFKLKRLSNALTYNSNAIFITDAHGHFEYVNKSFEETTGYTLDAILRIKNFVFGNKLKRITAIKDTWTGEGRYYKRNGEKFYALTTVSAIKNSKNEITSYVGVSQDISEIKKQDLKIKEKEILLIQQSKMAAIGEMFENMAHQWRQPLSVISICSSNLKLLREMDTLDDKEFYKSVDNIFNNALYLSDTIDDFRNFFKEDKNTKNFKLNEVITKTMTLLEAELKILNITVITQVDDIDVYGIPNELIQVFMNIILNAKEELLKVDCKKYIFIDAYIEKNNVIIEIKDNAGGIKNAIINQVFDSHFTFNKKEGTGIGLYMSKLIVEDNMNGKLSLENKTFTYQDNEYKGANFKILIPQIL
ncbi:MAG: hypothetical protein COA66_01365 [Arcobacter sp.]|nr:MAG: hypothetical protein COA66_01365 [Arcobacter sp.]